VHSPTTAVENSRNPIPSSRYDPRKKSDLLQTHPEASLMIESLGEDENVSNAISSAAAHYDPALLDRMALGYATNSDNLKNSSMIPIIAIADGVCGNKVRLILNQYSELGLSEKSGATLQVPQILGDESFWQGGGAPIQNIKTCHAINDAWMAVQVANSTTVFRPLYNKLPMTIPRSCGNMTRDKQAPSRLDPNPVAIITTAQTGGISHADISFNPWYPQQISIIDRKMNWTVWEMEGTSSFKAVRGPSGNSFSYDHRETDGFGIDAVDGWGSACWTAVDKLAVCSRRRFSLYHIGDQVEGLPGLGPDFLLESEWILGIQNNPADLSEIFLLTSLRIVWLRIGQVTTTQADTLLSWRHFRSTNDVSLALHVINADDGENKSSMILLKLNADNLCSYNCTPIFSSQRFGLGVSFLRSVCRVVDTCFSVGSYVCIAFDGRRL
jgi:RNA polymerase I-specific transcription initiation factor RRN6